MKDHSGGYGGGGGTSKSSGVCRNSDLPDHQKSLFSHLGMGNNDTTRGRPANRLQPGTDTRRGRSDSPRRHAIDNSFKAREEVVEDHEDSGEHPFADPFARLDLGKDPSRALSTRNGPPIEYVWPLNGSNPTQEAEHLRRFVSVIKKNKYRAEDTDGIMLTGLDEIEADNVATNFTIFHAHAAARIHRDKYATTEYENKTNSRVLFAMIGNVLSLPVKSQLLDANVGIDSLERGNGIHGSTSEKRRTGVVIDVCGSKALIAHGTGTMPKEQYKDQYFYLVQKDDKNQDPGMAIAKVTFGGSMCLDKPTWGFQAGTVDRSQQTPVCYEGELCLERYNVLADALNLPKDAPLRQAAKKRQQRSMAALGTTEEQMERRRKRFAPNGVAEPKPEDVEDVETVKAEVVSLKSKLAIAETTILQQKNAHHYLVQCLNDAQAKLAVKDGNDRTTDPTTAASDSGADSEQPPGAGSGGGTGRVL
ncbi:hypothetical protein LTR36_006523 [Oleoguttula mirabilis]|uniref:Uncharacterized protein n=1 Tax=Oleoguttula mirabilis TaxID=1507867 RepID=A0AAV9JWQ2_9PEZI|nr:hypothetical protein LTR36_006523 [Oleoguttula mirabilis]